MRARRIAIGRVWQETNSFSQRTSTLADFQRSDWLEGEALLASLGARQDELAGFADVLGPAGCEMVPLIAASCWPGGPVEPELFAAIFDKLDRAMAAAGPVDGVVFSVHGALSSDAVADIEGAIFAFLRRAYPHTPIAATFDHHGNITREIVANVDCLTAYRLCPHVDTRETGARGARMLLSLLDGSLKPAIAFRKIPLVTPAERFMTASGPMADWFAAARRMEAEGAVRDVALFPVQPWLDLPEFGWSVVVTADTQPAADRAADELARHAWENRRKFYVEKLTPAAAVAQAMATPSGPVVLADGADATNGGSPGDSTALIAEMLAQGVDRPAFVTLVDPRAVALAFEAGEGAIIRAAIGAGTSTRYHKPVPVEARVQKLNHGRFRISGHITADVDLGRMVVLAVGALRIVVSEHAGPGHDPAIYRHMGLEPIEAQIVVVKSTVGHMDVFGPIMKQSLAVEAPGPSPSYLEKLDRTRTPRPTFPLDQSMEWTP